MYWKGAHTTHRIMYHIVWTPKYRKRVLKGAVAKRIKELLEQCSEVNDWFLEELNINLDHVHMVVRLKPNISVSNAVQLFKGGSSRIIRKEFSKLEEFLWGDSFWADGFFVETVGKVDLETIKKYVQSQ